LPRESVQAQSEFCSAKQAHYGMLPLSISSHELPIRYAEPAGHAGIDSKAELELDMKRFTK
jgi:hypothetical protein